MHDQVRREGRGLVWQNGHEQLWIVPWGRNGVRVRATAQASFLELPQALLAPPKAGARTVIKVEERLVSLRNGNVRVEISPRGNVTFVRTTDDAVLLKEWVKNTNEHLGRNLIPCGSHWQLEQRFYANEGEKLYGLGQRQHGFLDQKGCTLELLQRNMEVTIPFMISNRGYGFLWNHPGTGRVGLGRNETRWFADNARQLDYYVVIDDTPADILERYAEATGKPTAFPEWASGFWQCKLRYRSQDEVMRVAREYRRRKLPISVIIIDFHHWTQQGDWTFDPKLWPDPGKMVKALARMGIKVMVSVWPTVSLTSENYREMRARGLLLRNERGRPVQNTSGDSEGSEMQTFCDSTHPGARDFIWSRIRENYYKLGIKLFWLDTMEPETIPLEPDNTRYHLGLGTQVGSLYPLLHQRAFYEGLKGEGEEAVLTLGRSAWAGSQRYGSAVWSADIPSTFDSLRRQVAGGLNIGLSGIPWWTSDIGGFYGLTIEDPACRELFVRWFQFGVFCPICRVHGVRRTQNPVEGENAPNEVWSYGEEAYKILRRQLGVRERLRPYIHEHMRVSQQTGAPLMRPLFFDFPDETECWEIEDQYMFGPDVLVAPITSAQTFRRPVYLPAGVRWRHAWTGTVVAGGETVEVDAPLSEIPVFIRADSGLDLAGGKTERKRAATRVRCAPRVQVQALPPRELRIGRDFTSEEFTARRKTVARRIGKHAHALVCSAPPTPYGEGGQDALFYYLCGLETTHTYLLVEGGSGETTLFIPTRKESGEPLNDALGIEDAAMLKERLLVQSVRPVSRLTQCLKRVTTLYTPHTPVEGRGATRWGARGCERRRMEHEWDTAEPRDARLRRLLSERLPDIDIEDLSPILDDMRTVKSPAEIALLREAGRLSARVMIEAMKATRPGATETQLQAIAEYVFRHHGHCGKGYGIIAASGRNTWNGHYGCNNAVLRSGDVVLMDCGPDLRHYTSDIARVWPVSGTYTPWQRRVYGFITEYHKVLLSLVAPGRTAREIYDTAAGIMHEKVRAPSFPYKKCAGLLRQMVKRDVGYLNHAVGLSVHDAVGSWRDRPLRPGLVLVVDPMIWCEPEQHYIRVEDTIVVTRDGCERLTGDAPFEPDAIEALMKEHSSFRV